MFYVSYLYSSKIHNYGTLLMQCTNSSNKYEKLILGLLAPHPIFIFVSEILISLRALPYFLHLLYLNVICENFTKMLYDSFMLPDFVLDTPKRILNLLCKEYYTCIYYH